MKLRQYQQECLQSIREHAMRGIRRLLVVQATGLGKAVQMASMPTALSLPRDKRMMVLVHRTELAYQMAEKLTACNPSRTVGIEKAEYYANDADLVVGSVQTLGGAESEGDPQDGNWKYGNRITKFNPDQFLIIQPDECHHLSSRSRQWAGILRYFKVLKGDSGEDHKKILCGWTATPNRADSLGLETFFDSIAYEYGIRQGVKDGWLASILAYRVETEVDISKVRTVDGDLSVPDLSGIINTPERNAIIAAKYTEVCPREPALFFTVSIQHSEDLAEMLTGHGYIAYPVSSNTPKDERKRIIAAFKAGEIHCLTSCSALSEGVDLPNARCGVMSRPTKSGLLFRQQIGRILRLHPSPEDLEQMAREGRRPPVQKPNAIIIDVCDVTGRHHLIDTPQLFGLREKFDLQGRSAIETAEEMERLEAENLGLDLQGDNLDEVKKRVDKIKTSLRSLSLLDPPQMPPELQRVTKLVWLKEGPGSYRLGCMDGTMLSVRENTLGGMEVYRHNKGVRTLLLTAKTLTEAVRMAEHEIPEKDRKVMRMDSAWRNEPPTEKQIRFLFTMDRKMKSEFPSPDAMFQFCMNQFNAGQLNFSRGEISKRIDAVRGARG